MTFTESMLAYCLHHLSRSFLIRLNRIRAACASPGALTSRFEAIADASAMRSSRRLRSAGYQVVQVAGRFIDIEAGAFSDQHHGREDLHEGA